jgi:hypothetical protein
MSSNKNNPFLALGAAVVGIAAVLVASFVGIIGGLAMMLLPLWMIYTAAEVCELFALVFRTPAPLTRDFITIGRVSYYGDTTRTRNDLLPELVHPTFEHGLKILQ